uniref:Uncharacterized protein n=1 Tax=Oryza rufipogon TaxID=4529 RepID=A0A0E0R5B6_ORYRU
MFDSSNARFCQGSERRHSYTRRGDDELLDGRHGLLAPAYDDYSQPLDIMADYSQILTARIQFGTSLARSRPPNRSYGCVEAEEVMRGGGVHVCVSKPKTTDDRSPELKRASSTFGEVTLKQRGGRRRQRLSSPPSSCSSASSTGCTLSRAAQVEPPGVQDDMAAAGDKVVVVLAAGAVLRRGHRLQVFVRAAAAAAAKEALEHRVLRRQRLHRRPRREAVVPGEELVPVQKARVKVKND